MPSNDDEWLPPKQNKEKPSNFALLKAKTKKGKRKTSVEFRCAHCPKRCSSKVQLKNHTKKTHGTSNREYRCDVDDCEQVFRFHNLLKTHKKTHAKRDGVKPRGKRHHCEACGKSFSRSNNFRRHLFHSHGGKPILRCPKCGFSTKYKFALRRHHALIHLRGRNKFIPRRQIRYKRKVAARKYLSETTDSTPKRRETLEKRFALTPNSQRRLMKLMKEGGPRAKRRLFREEGGGKKMDEWWMRVEPLLFQRFQEHRKAGAVVLRSHLFLFVLEIASEIGIDLQQMKAERGWKEIQPNIRKRISKFCIKNKIRLKRASRQVWKDPKDLSAAIARHVREMRRLIDDEHLEPRDIWCFDELRIYASPQDLNTMTLELTSVRDPLVRKVANPKEGYTGIVLASGDGETLAFVLVTTKGLPDGYEVYQMTLEQRKYDSKTKSVVVTPIVINFIVVHGITILKVPPGFKAWCGTTITEAWARHYMFKCDRPMAIQMDQAPGHLVPVLNRIVAASGRTIVWTPAGTSGYIQACDDTINATIQKAFSKVAMDWLIEKVLALQNQGNAGSVANPSLEEICQLLSKSLASLTPASQCRAFEHCLLTLPVDGSLDDERGGKSTMALLRKHGENLVPTKENAHELFPGDASAKNDREGLMGEIWGSLYERAVLEEEEFHYDHDNHREHPIIHKAPTAPAGSTAPKQKKFKCGVGCGIEYATRTYAMARVHEMDCPTRAFISSGWRPHPKSFLASKGFLFRHDVALNEATEDCSCDGPESCDVLHVID